MADPVITFLSDYGLQDEFVGVCHGVIAQICPQARVIDLTHGIPRHDVAAGATVLADALPFLPVGVHLAVVDPGVGSPRRAVALRLADARVLVGPDNGLLAPASLAGGGVTGAVDIGGSRFRLEPVSATFHGRDILAPVAAAIVAGAALADAGAPLDPARLVFLEPDEPRVQDGAIVARVRNVDGFGNLQLTAGPEHLAGSELAPGRVARLELASGRTELVGFVRTFADAAPGELLLYEDAQRRLAIAISHGDAAAALGLQRDDELRIRPA